MDGSGCFISVCLVRPPCRHSTAACERDEALLTECCTRQQAALRPTRPEVPKLLPAVACLWPPAVGALGDARLPVAERALGFTADLVTASGGFYGSM